MSPIELAEKRKILSRLMASGLSVRVKNTKSGKLLLERGITEVYIREMTVTDTGYIFWVNPDRVKNLRPWYQLTDEDLDLNHHQEGGATNEGS